MAKPIDIAAPTQQALVEVARAKGVPDHVLAGVKGLRRWDDLYPVTPDELEAALREFQSIRLG